MTHGSLFSGIGGFDLAAAWAGWTNVFNCEIDPFCRRVLKYHFPESEQYEDIRTTDFTVWRDRVDVLTGGFPCQPFSLAGKRRGTADDRYLWPAMLGVVRTVRPRWVVGENVLGIVNWSQGMVFEQVCADLEAAGYEMQAYLIPAAGVGAPHLRYRTWFVAHRGDARAESSWQERFGAIVAGDASDTGRVGLRERACEQELVEGCIRAADARACSADGAVVDADDKRWSASNTYGGGLRGEINGNGEAGQSHQKSEANDWRNFPTQSPICRGDDGLPLRLDYEAVRRVIRCRSPFSAWRRESIKAYGNAIVPQVALRIFETINEYERCR